MGDSALRDHFNGLLKDLSRQQVKFDRLPVEILEEKNRKLESRLGEIQNLGFRPIRSKITSSGLDPIQSNPVSFDSTHSNPIQSNPVSFDSTHSNPIQSNPASSNPVELNAIRADSTSSNPRHGIGSMPFQSNPSSSDCRTVDPPSRTMVEKVDYFMKHLECLNRHITNFEQTVEEQLDHHDVTKKEVGEHSTTLALSHNKMTDHVNYLLSTVDKMKKSWDNWSEWTPIDKEEEEEDSQEAQLPIREDPVQETQQPALLDITPVRTPVQSSRNIIPAPVATTTRVSTPECACSRLALPSLKGVTRIYVEDQTHFKVGRIIIICELFMAQVIGLGSLVLDRPLDRHYPAGSSIRELTPEDDYVVDARGRTIINGVVMDPSSSSQDNPNKMDTTTNRQLPPRPSEGVLVELQNESKLYTWLLQGMTRRGKRHWKDCSDYYERHEPTAIEVWPKEDTIKYDQYTKAFNHIGPIPSTEGRLMNVVEQVMVFEQNLLRTMKGLSPACEFYAKLLLHGIYHFLEQLRTLKTATEQATQTFAVTQAEEKFHPQLEALFITWLSHKLPEVVQKRTHNHRPQPSARILLTEFYFTLFPQPGDQAKHLGNLARNPTSTSQNTTDVIVNIETWRTSIQMLREVAGHMPMQEDIKSAFEKLISPLVKNIASFALTKTLCEREAYVSITTTDDDVYTYIISIVEAIHKLSKNTKWEAPKPKAQAINTAPAAVEQR